VDKRKEERRLQVLKQTCDRCL